jgi:AraC-like DNA-binding protein
LQVDNPRTVSVVSVLLDTSQLPADDRAEALQSALTGATAPHDLRLLGPSDKVHARLEYWQLNPDVALLHQKSSGVSHTRSTRHARREGPERVVFVLHDGGPGSYVHEGQAYPLRRGALYVTDLNSRYSYTRPGEGTARIIQVERSALDLTMEQVQHAAGQLQASPFYNLLRSHIAGLCAAAPDLAADDRASLAPITTHLAATLLRTAVPAEDSLQREAAHGYLIDRAVMYMRLNFSRPGLSAEDIARELGVSVRHLFQQWSTQPRSLAETLLDIRLSAGCSMLAARPQMPVSAIAYHCGFADASHFSRRFRLAYGVSPTQHRHELRDATRARTPLRQPQER